MTIKRRLSISNNLMIALPILLTIVLSMTIAFIFFQIQPRSFQRNRITCVSENQAAELFQKEEYVQASDEITVFNSNTHGFVFVFPESADMPKGYGLYNNNHIAPLLVLTFMIIIVYLTNRALTHYIFRSIMIPIDTLVNGVHEISDGNLSYRIQYDNNDEFSEICADFNEMALRLSDMVNQRQKDENNRKELIAGISHDLRTPLTSIKAYIEGIEKGVASTPQMQKKYLDTIKSKTNDLEYIINQLFLFSKLDIGEFPLNLEQIDIGDELRNMVAEFSDEYKDKDLIVLLTENVRGVFVAIDTIQFRNVINNILGNSVKYGNKNTIKSEIISRDMGDNVCIAITDNGPGVPEEALENLFDVFYRGDSSRKNTNTGSGLGLAISAKIIERLGGEISAENAPSGGLKVIITLPKCGGGTHHEKNIDS